ncbi:MAG: hypothetical protein IJH07_07955 [Ruminococcus sp.]|nr:hypothetical protein [Ruminococcus sp.]
MKQKLTPRWCIITLTGLLFAAYSAYNAFIIIRDRSALSTQAIFISVVVALMFSVLAAYALTSGLWSSKKLILFRIIRRVAFIIALLTIFALKLRTISAVLAYIDDPRSDAVLYACSYFMTLAGMLILLVYYIFIRRRFLFFPRASVLLPLIAAILFFGSFILEVILYFAYGICLEANLLRTVVIRPVFYLGFIGLSVYYMFPPQIVDPK